MSHVSHAHRVLEDHVAVRLEHEIDPDDLPERLARDRIADRHLHVVIDAGHQRGHRLEELEVLVHLQHGRERVQVRPRDLIEIDRGLAELVLAEDALDPRARRTLINLLRELPITMLVSTHDMKLVQELFPRTIVMDDGRIVADGKTGDILENEKLLYEHGLEKP